MKNVLLFSIMALALIVAGCGSGSGNKMPITSSGMSNMTLNTGDAVNPAILKFELTISSVTLTGTSPTPTTGNLLSRPAEVEFVHEAGTFEPMALANVPAGTYSGATLTVSNPEVVVVNGGVPTRVTATLSSSTITVNFSPAIMVTSSNSTVVNFDLDLATSVTLNGTPVTSATVSPTFNVTTSTVNNNGNEDDDNGEIEDVHGTVTNITAPNFTLQTRESMITFATDGNTRFRDGITQLSDLKVNDIVEVDGISKSDGTKLATKIEREGSSGGGKEVEGVISATTGTPATSITIAHQVDSDDTGNAPTTVDITINSSTVFSVRSDKLSLITPAFDASHIGKGQRIEADSTSNSSPVVATKLKLREQGIVGTVAASPAPTTSSFTLNIPANSAFGTLSGATTVAVTVPNGASLKVPPTAGTTLMVRGLVFVNGTTYTLLTTREDRN